MIAALLLAVLAAPPCRQLPGHEATHACLTAPAPDQTTPPDPASVTDSQDDEDADDDTPDHHQHCGCKSHRPAVRLHPRNGKRHAP